MSRTYYKTDDSGKVVYRLKNGVIPHTGIVLGRDINGQKYIIHKYPENGVVEETWEEFADGQTVYDANVQCLYEVEEVVKRAFAKLGEKYHLLDGNCQQFTNHACRNEHKSESLEIIGRMLLAVAAVFVVVFAVGLLISLLFGDQSKGA